MGLTPLERLMAAWNAMSEAEQDEFLAWGEKNKRQS
jgi:hypothetical protein